MPHCSRSWFCLHFKVVCIYFLILLHMYDICQQRQLGYCHCYHYLVLGQSRVYSQKWLLFVYDIIEQSVTLLPLLILTCRLFLCLSNYTLTEHFFYSSDCKNTCCSSAGNPALMNKGLAGASTSGRKDGAMSVEAGQDWIHDTRWYFLQCQSGSGVFQADPLPESQRWVPQGTISGSLTMSSQFSSQDKYRFN